MRWPFVRRYMSNARTNGGGPREDGGTEPARRTMLWRAAFMHLPEADAAMRRMAAAEMTFIV